MSEPINTRLPWFPEGLPIHQEVRDVPKLTARRIADARQHPITPHIATIREQMVREEIGNPHPAEGWEDVIEKTGTTSNNDRSVHFWIGVCLVMVLISVSGIITLAVSK